MKQPVILAFLVAVAAGCGRHAQESAPAPSASATPAAPPKGTLALGEPITSPMVSLSEVAAHPSQYEHRTIATSGKVTAVCQEMGCWMEMQDATGSAHIRMHGHNFFVPKTASGHVARVQATLVKGKDEECSEQSSAAGQGMAKVELDATGVELD